MRRRHTAQHAGQPGTKAGSDVAARSQKLGFQSHTTRAALSGLRKAGYEIAAEKSNAGKPTRYRITAAPDPADSRPRTKVSAHAGKGA
ncbi:MAG: DUF3489 domain-containing protein [Roseovarius sp.]